MKRLLLVVFVVVAVAASIGCGARSGEQTEEVEAAPIAEQPEPSAEEAAPSLEMVEVTAEGTEFDPPVLAEQLPEGAWYCAMDTVHYARMDEGDSKCGVCGMNLTQKEAAEESVPG